jgi:sialate O-acetylesterase
MAVITDLGNARDIHPRRKKEVGQRRALPARADIDGDAVVVSADGVTEPAAVPFNWRHNVVPYPVNREGLPAAPFRTDSW